METQGVCRRKNKSRERLNHERESGKTSGIVPEIKSLQVGINEKTSDMAYDAVLISTFEDADALARYKVHPEHVKVSNYCKKIRDSRVFVDFHE